MPYKSIFLAISAMLNKLLCVFCVYFHVNKFFSGFDFLISRRFLLKYNIQRSTQSITAQWLFTNYTHSCNQEPDRETEWPSQKFILLSFLGTPSSKVIPILMWGHRFNLRAFRTIQIEPYHVCLFGSHPFHSTLCQWDSSILCIVVH